MKIIMLPFHKVFRVFFYAVDLDAVAQSDYNLQRSNQKIALL